jgi:hypothetical protein
MQKKILDKLNIALGCIDFKISIDYVFQMDTNTYINIDPFENNTLLLCMFDKNSCISSLRIYYTDYTGEIDIASKTSAKYEGNKLNKLNKLLRSIIIIISKHLYPFSKYIKSSAINPTSAYLMLEYLNALPVDSSMLPLDIKLNSYDEINKYFIENGGLITKVELTDANIENAQNVFDKTIKEIKCGRDSTIGGKKIRSRKANKKRKNPSKKHKNRITYSRKKI